MWKGSSRVLYVPTGFKATKQNGIKNKAMYNRNTLRGFEYNSEIKTYIF